MTLTLVYDMRTWTNKPAIPCSPLFVRPVEVRLDGVDGRRLVTVSVVDGVRDEMPVAVTTNPSELAEKACWHVVEEGCVEDG